MDLELIGSESCPYTQRVAIALAERGIEHIRTNVELDDIPEWIRDVSPLGEVPVLLAGGEPIFDSIAIMEFLNDVEGGLLPGDAFLRSKARSWSLFASACQRDVGAMSKTEGKEFTHHRAELYYKLGQLEAELGEGPYFFGERFTLVDCAFAPTLIRLTVMSEDASRVDLASFPRVESWAYALRSHEAVKATLPGDDEPEHLVW